MSQISRLHQQQYRRKVVFLIDEEHVKEIGWAHIKDVLDSTAFAAAMETLRAMGRPPEQALDILYHTARRLSNGESVE